MLCMIAACDRRRVIGCSGSIPWDLPEDRAYFRRITSGGIVVMGRKTFEEIGIPLADRFHIVISRTRQFSGRELVTARSLDEALRLAQIQAARRQCGTFLCGGQTVYEQGMALAQRLYVTRIDAEFEGDTFFPEVDPREFSCTACQNGSTPGVTFYVYERTSCQRDFARCGERQGALPP